MAKSRKPKLAIGDVVADRYRIDGIVGKGGFGAVYRATQLDTGLEVALKVLLKNYASSKTDSKRFRREAALVQKLRHPNVVELLDFGYTTRGQPFIAFELLQGQAVGQLLKAHGPLPQSQAGEVAADVLEALRAAHDFGVIHRDIKPGNLFLLSGGGSKVLDFGIAKAVTGEEAGGTQLTEAGQMIGTPHYMSPEQVRGTGVVPATDLYSLGLCLAEMISGERVIKGSALIDVYMAHITDDPIPFKEVVRQSPMWPVIERATHKSLSERYSEAAQMMADLERVRPMLPDEAPVQIEPAPETVRSNKGGLASAGGRSAQPSSLGSDPSPASTETGTLLMDRPELEARGRAIIEAVRRASEQPHTLNMSNEQLRAALEDELKQLPRSADSARGPLSSQTSSSGEHVSISGDFAPSQSSSGEHQLAISGEHYGAASQPGGPPSMGFGSGSHDLPAAVSQAEGPPPTPAADRRRRQPPKSAGGSGLALFLIAVAVVALAAAVLLLIGPWSG